MTARRPATCLSLSCSIRRRAGDRRECRHAARPAARVGWHPACRGAAVPACVAGCALPAGAHHRGGCLPALRQARRGGHPQRALGRHQPARHHRRDPGRDRRRPRRRRTRGPVRHRHPGCGQDAVRPERDLRRGGRGARHLPDRQPHPGARAARGAGPRRGGVRRVPQRRRPAHAQRHPAPAGLPQRIRLQCPARAAGADRCDRRGAALLVARPRGCQDARQASAPV